MVRILVLLITALISHSVFAAGLVEGQWNGKITMHGKKSDEVRFRVRSKQNDDLVSYKVDMFYKERPFKFEKLKVDTKEMKFVLDTGVEYDCVLSLDDKEKKDIEDCKNKEGYCGKCIHSGDGEVRKIIINMLPPLEAPDTSEQDDAEAEKIMDPIDLSL